MPKDSLRNLSEPILTQDDKMRKLHVELDELLKREGDLRRKYDAAREPIFVRRKEIFAELQSLNRGKNK